MPMSLSAEAPWLRFYGTMPTHLDYPEKTLWQLVHETAQANPGLCAYEFLGKKTTYAEFTHRVEQSARALYRIGIRRGDRVTICMPNSPQAVDCFYALSRLGAVSNMIHPLSAVEEIRFYLRVSGSKAVLALDRFYDKLTQAMQGLEYKPTLLLARIPDELSLLTRLGYRLTEGKKDPKLPNTGDFLFWSELLRHADNTLPPDDSNCRDCASILYSGGTTGTTKGICLSGYSFNALALQTIAASGLSDLRGQTMLSIMPIFHGFGLGIGIHTALVGGAKCLLVPNFSIRLYAKLLRTKKPNLIPGVPTLFEALLRAEGLEHTDLSFLTGVFSGGDSLSVELKRKVDSFLLAHGARVQIREGYGTTECVTASCLTPADYAREGSIGIPFPDTYYKIVRPGTCEELDARQEGEICLSGPSVMLGYLDNPEETALVLCRHADGKLWLHTGDLGMMDEDGFVYFRQRIKRMIVSSGYNVYPSRIENVLDSHEKVLLSCVIGVKDPYKMQKVKAFVVLRPGITASDALRHELMDYCAARIARYALPYAIEFREDLPKTRVGKVAYRVLEEEEAQKEAKQ